MGKGTPRSGSGSRGGSTPRGGSGGSAPRGGRSGGSTPPPKKKNTPANNNTPPPSKNTPPANNAPLSTPSRRGQAPSSGAKTILPENTVPWLLGAGAAGTLAYGIATGGDDDEEGGGGQGGGQGQGGGSGEPSMVPDGQGQGGGGQDGGQGDSGKKDGKEPEMPFWVKNQAYYQEQVDRNQGIRAPEGYNGTATEFNNQYLNSQLRDKTSPLYRTIARMRGEKLDEPKPQQPAQGNGPTEVEIAAMLAKKQAADLAQENKPITGEGPTDDDVYNAQMDSLLRSQGIDRDSVMSAFGADDGGESGPVGDAGTAGTEGEQPTAPLSPEEADPNDPDFQAWLRAEQAQNDRYMANENIVQKLARTGRALRQDYEQGEYGMDGMAGDVLGAGLDLKGLGHDVGGLAMAGRMATNPYSSLARQLGGNQTLGKMLGKNAWKSVGRAASNAYARSGSVLGGAARYGKALAGGAIGRALPFYSLGEGVYQGGKELISGGAKSDYFGSRGKGAAAALANSLTFGGFDTVAANFSDEYAKKTGASKDPLGTAWLTEKIYNAATGGNRPAVPKARVFSQAQRDALNKWEADGEYVPQSQYDQRFKQLGISDE